MEADANVMSLFFRRVGDAERDACVEILVEHHVLGRLSAEEMGRRQDAALRATTAAELAGLVCDLPRAGGAGQPDSTRRSAAVAAEPALLPVQLPPRAKLWVRAFGPPVAVAVTA